MIFLGIATGECIKSRLQAPTDRIFDTNVICLICVGFIINNVVASYVYNTYLTDNLFIYWIASATAATLMGIFTDFISFWGLMTYEKGVCLLLRKFKTLPDSAYYFGMILNFILSIGWIFTISNNLTLSDSINPTYFLMILSYI